MITQETRVAMLKMFEILKEGINASTESKRVFVPYCGLSTDDTENFSVDVIEYVDASQLCRFIDQHIESLK